MFKFLRNRYRLIATALCLAALVLGSLVGIYVYLLNAEMREEFAPIGTVMRQVPLSEVLPGSFVTDARHTDHGYIVVFAGVPYDSYPNDGLESKQLRYLLPDLESETIYAVNDAAKALTPSFPSKPELMDEIDFLKTGTWEYD